MPVLKCLLIDFQPQCSVSACSVLARAPVIPTLKELYLGSCVMKMHDFTTFIGKHSATWTRLSITDMSLFSGTKADLSDLYERLSQSPNIEIYRQRSFFLGPETLDLPSQVCWPIDTQEEDEDGFVQILQTNWVRWKGHDEVTAALDLMAKHLRS